MEEPLLPKWDLTVKKDNSIFESLRRYKIPLTEDGLIDTLYNHKNKYILAWSATVLRALGTEKCIDALKSVILKPYIDVQGISALTIGFLAGGKENKFLGNLLSDKRFRNKWYAMYALFIHADDSAVPVILDYAEKVIKNSKNLPICGGLMLLYLARYASDNNRARKIFNKVNKDFNMMPIIYQNELKNEFPTIFGI